MPDLEWIADERVMPHLQTLADESFAGMVKLAQGMGLDMATMPFDFMDGHVGNQWKACILQFLHALLPPISVDK